MASALRHDRLFGHGQGLVPLRKNRRDAGEHTRAQLHAAVVDARAQTQGAAVGVNQRVDRLHERRKLATGQGIELQLRALAGTHPRLKALGQPVIHVNRIHVLKVDHIGPVLEIVPEIDRTYAHCPVEGGQDLQTVGCGFGQGQLGQGHFEVGGAFFDRAAADEVLLDQLLVAVEIGARNRHLRLGLLDLGLGQLVVELDQQLPLDHALTIAKVDLGDAAADLGPDDHVLTRAQAAYRLGLIHQGGLLDLRHFHRRLAAPWSCGAASRRSPSRCTPGCSSWRCPCGRPGRTLGAARRRRHSSLPRALRLG